MCVCVCELRDTQIDTDSHGERQRHKRRGGTERDGAPKAFAYLIGNEKNELCI